jgi:hypothetical protein
MKRIGVSNATFALPLAACGRSSENLKPQTDFIIFGLAFIQYDTRLSPADDGTIELPNNFRRRNHSMVAKTDPRIEKAGR